MSDKTKIEWTDATWNPVTGCSRVSAGCKHCYAETFTNRFKGVPGHHFERGFKVTLRPEMLEIPLRWKKPRRIFVNSLSDLFHAEVPFEFIDSVFTVMAMAPQHTFQILTKRPERMHKYMEEAVFRVYDSIMARRRAMGLKDGPTSPLGKAASEIGKKWWPLENVHLGVSVEDQAAADTRIEILQQTPAAVRFISCEPLLGPVNLYKVQHIPAGNGMDAMWRDPLNARNRYGREWMATTGIDWVIVGGESGPGSRPMNPEWARLIRDQCAAAGVPFMFKQWGEFVPCGMVEDETLFKNTMLEGTIMCRVGKRAAGRLLDGVEHNGAPGDNNH